MKLMKRLTNGQINRLKELAQKTGPGVRVGKAGVSAAFLKGLDEALSGQELVKVRFSEFKDQKLALATQMAEKTDSELVWVIGHMAVFYRENPDPTKRKVTFPAPRPRHDPRFGPPRGSSRFNPDPRFAPPRGGPSRGGPPRGGPSFR